MDAIATQTDFLGVNYYTRQIIRDRSIPEEQNHPQTVFQAPRDDKNWQEMPDWEVYPDGLFNVLSELYLEYQVPQFYITENGASYSDGPDDSGRVPTSAGSISCASISLLPGVRYKLECPLKGILSGHSWIIWNGASATPSALA